MNQNLQKLESIQERDIDLLLLEELNVNADFTQWFVHQCELPSLSTFKGTWHSISDFGLGETDLFESLIKPTGCICPYREQARRFIPRSVVPALH